jgi:uncharacterized protein (TIGR02266 family)
MPITPGEQTNRTGGRTDMGRANRVALQVPVQLREGGASFDGVIRNIGPGGVFLATLRPLAVGARVVLTLDLRGDPQLIEVLAEVRWCRPFVELDGRPAGVGLRFINAPLRAAIVGALRRSPPVATAATKRR